jgi:hypothetical protein
MLDLATDINVIRVYFGEAENGYGWLMLGMVLATVGLQLLIVVAQNGKAGKAGLRKLLLEMLITVIGLKPGESESVYNPRLDVLTCLHA